MYEGFQIGRLTIERGLIMAPMCGISDSPWRRMARRFGAGLVFTEMVSSEALIRDRERSFQLLHYEAEETPVAMQFCGSAPEPLTEAAKKAEALGAALVDLNMGCPVKKIVSQGAGSALLLDLPRVARILHSMVSAVRIPVTLKIRSGWDERHPVALEVARIAEAEGVAALTVHARTRAQAFSGKADWRVIRSLVEATKLPVIGNGDVLCPTSARAMMTETGCAGVMIGRGAQGRPWLFQEILDPTFQMTTAERRTVIREHFERACEFYGAERGVRLMRKHLAWYSRGFQAGNHFRDAIMRLSEASAVIAEIEAFFTDDRLAVDLKPEDPTGDTAQDCRLE